MNYRDEVAVVRRLTKQIEQVDSKVEGLKWQRADLLACLCETATQQRVAQDTGLSQHTVSVALKIVRKYPARDNRPRYADADYEAQGRGPGFGSSANTLPEKLTYPEKVELARKLIKDPVVRAAVQPHIDKPIPPVVHHERSLIEEWEAWLTRLNSLLTDGARLTDRSEGVELTAYAVSARLFYERITERQLDTELRSFFEEVEA